MEHAISPQLGSSEAWFGHKAHCVELIERYGARDVCEIGGGRDPLLSVEEAGRLGLRYTVLDVSASELQLADPAYEKICADICGDDLSAGERFDLMFSKMVAEHV